jgi:hypothetical protein
VSGTIGGSSDHPAGIPVIDLEADEAAQAPPAKRSMGSKRG